MLRFRLTLLLLGALIGEAYSQPAISFTFDDGITANIPGYAFELWNDMLLDHLDHAGIKAAFFVTGSNKLDDKGKFLLQTWDVRGHKIANHTFSHPELWP